MLLAVETVELVSQLFLLLEELLLAGGIRLSSSARGIQRHTETIADNTSSTMQKVVNLREDLHPATHTLLQT